MISMKDLYKLIPLALLMCFQMQTGYSQHAFVIGENNEAYHELIADHPISLLEVCNNSMEESYKTWPLVLKSRLYNKHVSCTGLKCQMFHA